MPRNAKDQDTNLRRAVYRFSSVIRLTDNILWLVYASKPQDTTSNQFQAWLQLEQTVLNTRALALDALSFINDLRQEQAIKATISPNYHKPPNKDEVFGEELYQTIKAENESNRLLNDAAFQKKRAYQNKRNQSSYNINYKTPQKQSSYNGKYKNNNNSWKGKSQKSENFSQGGQSPRQS